MLAMLHLGTFRPAFKSIKINWSASNKKNYSKFPNFQTFRHILTLKKKKLQIVNQSLS